MIEARNVVLIDGSETREVLAERLRMQGFVVRVTADPAEGAHLALSQPPSAVVADLWMPGISGVQLCRLLRTEAATEHVPIILRGPENDQRNRFWASRAGAAAYVVKGRMGDLVRALDSAIAAAPESSSFFVHLSGADTEIRDRIAASLDAALFESVIASEVRGLSVCGAFDRLFDLFSQLVTRVTTYRWMAISTHKPERAGLHAHPSMRASAEAEARAQLRLGATASMFAVEDEDAFADEAGPPAIVEPILFGGEVIGELALATRAPQHPKDPSLVTVLARELAGPLRIVSLVEESQHLARIDPLTGLMNRRAMIASLDREIARAVRLHEPLSLMLLDVDHFKAINDRRGHASGDTVLAALGKLLAREIRAVDLAARWGGEEFVIGLCAADKPGGVIAAERIRQAVEAMSVADSEGTKIPVTVSIGLAAYRPGDDVEALVDRADRAMYLAKSAGRNRVVIDPDVASAA